MRKSRVIEIVDWRKTQHYTGRNPPWIKLQSSYLDDARLQSMSSCDFGVYCKLLLIASRCGNRIVFDVRLFRRRHGVSPISIRNLERAGLITITDSDDAQAPDQSPVGDRSSADWSATGDRSESDRNPIGTQSNTDRASIVDEQELPASSNQSDSSKSASTPPAGREHDACSEERDLRGRDRDISERSERSQTVAVESSDISTDRARNLEKLHELLSDEDNAPLKNPLRESRRSRNGDFDQILDRVEKYFVEHSLKGVSLGVDDDNTRREIATAMDCTERQIDTAIQQLKNRKRLPLERRRSNGAAQS